MLQIDHIYEFLYKEIFNNFELFSLKNQYPNIHNVNISDMLVFTPEIGITNKIFFYDQEPLLDTLTEKYLDMFNFPEGYTIDEISKLNNQKSLPYGIGPWPIEEIEFYKNNPDLINPKNKILSISEKSEFADQLSKKHNYHLLYYFFHGFASLDWYRGHYTLNYNKQVVKEYKNDFITFNRLINKDRSYRIYFVSKLVETGLVDKGRISFNVVNDSSNWQDEVGSNDSKLSAHARSHAEKYLINFDKISIDSVEVPGSASADILRDINIYDPNGTQIPSVDSYWHIVTETVFYYNKLHLTEKIFKPIVTKQPFMLLAAPGNLEYLRSYGFKTFDAVIDESYDNIQDHDDRIDAVVKQLAWYCNLSVSQKIEVMKELEPIIEHNFHWFYNDFKHIVTTELLVNTKNLFKQINEDDSHINYRQIYELLTK